MTTHKILVWDVETAHMELKQWGLWDKFTPIENIIKDWYIICGAWKWLGDKKIHAVSVLDDPIRFKENIRDDYYVVATLHQILSEADAIIHHYGDAFDLKKFNARAIFHGLGPLPELIQIDTVKMAKQKFAFSSNKLDYIGDFLGVGRKIPTGSALWLRCEAGERKAIREMVTYNRQDVQLLEDVYMKLRPYAPSPKFNHNIVDGDGCPTCGEETLQRRGFYRTITRVYQRYQCTSCGSWSRSVASEKDTKARMK